MARAAGNPPLSCGRHFRAVGRKFRLLARVYPNGLRDVNHFSNAAPLWASLIDSAACQVGLLCMRMCATVWGKGLSSYAVGGQAWRRMARWARSRFPRSARACESGDDGGTSRFQPNGRREMLTGNSRARGVIKILRRQAGAHVVEAPARVFPHSRLRTSGFFHGRHPDRCFIACALSGRKGQRHCNGIGTS